MLARRYSQNTDLATTKKHLEKINQSQDQSPAESTPAFVEDPKVDGSNVEKTVKLKEVPDLNFGTLSKM